MTISRREFLKYLGLLGSGALAASCRSMKFGFDNGKAGNGVSNYHYQVPDWTGDNPTPMHRIRDWAKSGTFPTLPAPSKAVDMVIIGGGLSGLALAYYLRNESFLLLERENELGGNAKSAQYQGITYSQGSAYLVDTSEPFGPLYEELGLDLKPVPKPDNLLLNGKGEWQGFEDRNTDSMILLGYERLKKHLAGLLDKPDFPGLPIQQATPDMLRLDNGSFYDYLKNDYPPALLRYIDAYCQSALGGSIQQISAYAGINFYSEIAGDIVAFPGGNAAIAKKLVGRINENGSNRMQTGVSVIQIEDKGNAVWVTYMDNASQALTTVSAKQAVLAVPFVIASRILKNANAKLIDTLRSCHYGSYLVANCCFDTVPGNTANMQVKNNAQALFGYDHWLPQPLSKSINRTHAFTDFIVADWVNNQQHTPLEKTPFVLTLYAPFSQGSLGRQRMLSQPPKVLASEMVSALQRQLAFSPETLKEVRLTRYGHQLLRSETGLIRRLSTMPRQVGSGRNSRIHLCHSDGQGMAAIESAITEASLLAKQLLAK